MHEEAERWLAFAREDLRMGELARAEAFWNQPYLYEIMAPCLKYGRKRNAHHYPACLFEVGNRPRHP